MDALADVSSHLMSENHASKWNGCALPPHGFGEQIVITGKQGASKLARSIK